MLSLLSLGVIYELVSGSCRTEYTGSGGLVCGGLSHLSTFDVPFQYELIFEGSEGGGHMVLLSMGSLLHER